MRDRRLKPPSLNIALKQITSCRRESPRQLRRGDYQRAAAAMSLIHSTRLNGHDVYAYMKDVLERLPTLPASRISELLHHRWVAQASV
jgi:hypothetical protein